MKTLYEKVKRQLEHIDFEALWPGFHPFPFALYDGTRAILDGQLMDCPRDFRGNTAAAFRGRLTAIWNVEFDLPEDDVIFASKLVHEMFHAFQMERKEKRFPNDLLLAAAELSPEYLAIKAEECRFLSKPDGLPRFLALREMRKAVNGGCIQEEFLAETIEGMAQYIELCALEQLSVPKQPPVHRGRCAEEHPARPKSRSGDRLQTALAECAKRLADPGLLLDPRRCAYDSGSLLLFAARRHGLTLFHDIGNESRPVYEIVLQQLPRILTADYPVSLDAETLAPWSRLLSEQAARREALIQAFLQEAHITIEGCFRICGYDPMNLWRREDTLYSTSFLCLLDQNGNTVTLTGKALLRMYPGSPDTARAYSTMTPGT